MQLGSSAPFVPNDLVLDDRQRMLVITGPNMGGKSTYMRQTALIVILAHIGSFVPADAAVIGPVDRIFTRIGAADDLTGGRSTFMVEMTETANILNSATRESLVLMDEVGRGTSTFDGLSLAWAAARHIAQRIGAFTLFATHYFELTSLPEELPAVANVHLTATEHGRELDLPAQRESRTREPELRAARGRARGRAARRRRARTRVLATAREASASVAAAEPAVGALVRAAAAPSPHARAHRAARGARRRLAVAARGARFAL